MLYKINIFIKQKNMRKVAIILFIALSIGFIFMFTGCSAELPNSQATESTKAPEKLSAPWGSYEEVVYVTSSAGKQTDNSKYIINSIDTSGKKFYKIDRTVYLKDGTYTSGATLNFTDLVPVSSYIDAKIKKDGKVQISDIKGEYNDVLTINSNVDGKVSSSKINLPKQFFDNEYLAMAIREFTIKEGFSTQVNICSLSAGKMATLSLKVVGKEKVKVPYGEVECYKLEFFAPGKNDTPPLNFWISSDEKRNLIKYGQTGNFIELKSIKY